MTRLHLGWLSSMVLCGALAAAPPRAHAQGEKDKDKGAATDKDKAAAAQADKDKDKAAEASADDLKIDDLRKEYESIREDLFTSRARAAAVGDAVYSSRLRVTLTYGAARFYTVRRATIRLDGTTVYDDSAGAVATDEAPRFEGFVAPGRHVITIRVEAQAKDDDRFVYTAEDSFTIDAPAKKEILLEGKATDSGDIAWSWKKKSHGAYKLRLDVDVSATDLTDADTGTGAPTPAAKPAGGKKK